MFHSRMCRLLSAQCGRVASALAGLYSLERHQETAGPPRQDSRNFKPQPMYRPSSQTSSDNNSFINTENNNLKHLYAKEPKQTKAKRINLQSGNIHGLLNEWGSERSHNISGLRELCISSAADLYAV